MHRLIIRAAVLTAGAAIPAGGLAAPAAADDFGQHVRTCGQTMGFDGEHNPGMHQGFRGWSPEHTCGHRFWALPFFPGLGTIDHEAPASAGLAAAGTGDPSGTGKLREEPPSQAGGGARGWRRAG